MTNKAILEGKIVKKQYRLTKEGCPLCTITLETRKNYINSEGKECNESIWHMVNFFDQLGLFSNESLHIGETAYIEGEIINKKVKGIIVTSIKGNLFRNKDLK